MRLRVLGQAITKNPIRERSITYIARLESWRWSEGIMNRILLKENACGKEMNIHIKGSATEGICFTIQIPNEGIDREGR